MSLLTHIKLAEEPTPAQRSRLRTALLSGGFGILGAETAGLTAALTAKDGHRVGAALGAIGGGAVGGILGRGGGQVLGGARGRIIGRVVGRSIGSGLGAYLGHGSEKAAVAKTAASAATHAAEAGVGALLGGALGGALGKKHDDQRVSRSGALAGVLGGAVAGTAMGTAIRQDGLYHGVVEHMAAHPSGATASAAKRAAAMDAIRAALPNKPFGLGSNKAVARAAAEAFDKAAAVVEVPHNHHPVVVEPPQVKRKEFPFVGFIDFQGLKIDVENKKGEYRRGTDKDGHEWKCFMHAHYGEIRDTRGTDGDNLDVYVGPNHDASLVVVIRQHKPDTGAFDEDKVMVGYDSIEQAIGAYKLQYDKPGFYKDGDYLAMPIGKFWRWVHDERKQGKKVANVLGHVKVAVDAVELTQRLKNVKGLHVHNSSIFEQPHSEADAVTREMTGAHSHPTRAQARRLNRSVTAEAGQIHTHPSSLEFMHAQHVPAHQEAHGFGPPLRPAGPLSAAGRDALHSVVQTHELSERGVKPRDIAPMFSGEHLSPDVVMKEHNMVSRLSGLGAEEAVPIMRNMRAVSGEHAKLTRHFVDAFKDPRAAQFLEHGNKVPKAMRRRFMELTKNIVKHANVLGHVKIAVDTEVLKQRMQKVKGMHVFEGSVREPASQAVEVTREAGGAHIIPTSRQARHLGWSRDPAPFQRGHIYTHPNALEALHTQHTPEHQEAHGFGKPLRPAGPLSPAGRDALHSTAQTHELAERGTKPRDANHLYAGHMSPDVLVQDHNMLSRLSGAGAEEVTQVMRNVRNVTGESAKLKDHLVSAFKDPRAAQFLEHGEKVPKAMRRRFLAMTRAAEKLRIGAGILQHVHVASAPDVLPPYTEKVAIMAQIITRVGKELQARTAMKNGTPGAVPAPVEPKMAEADYVAHATDVDKTEGWNPHDPRILFGADGHFDRDAWREYGNLWKVTLPGGKVCLIHPKTSDLAITKCMAAVHKDIKRAQVEWSSQLRGIGERDARALQRAS